MTNENELAISTEVIPAESSIVKKEDGNVACTALMPSQMADSQTALIAWAKDKVETMKAESTELHEAWQHAKDRKWATGTLRKHFTLAIRRVTFYEKILAALEAGFVIVPNFPVAMFAIRTENESPVYFSHRTPVWAGDPLFEQEAEALPIGAGEYQNPLPVTWRSKPFDVEGSTTKHVDVETVGWKELNFPITMAKPEIMRATDRAMALKIFDQFGILPAEARSQKRAKGDPVIVGQLLDPRGRVVTFMIAWHLDTRTL